MADIEIAGIMRAGVYSPNHIGNDAAIFNVVAEQLRKRGCIVRIYSEEQFIAADGVDEPVIINMCREQRSIELLQKAEDEGKLVINSGYGIENCIRERMARILIGSNIPYPESIIVRTDEAVRDRLERAGMHQCWIKRGDFHAQHKEDVSYVRHTEEAQEVLQEYFLRGIKRAVINRHLDGPLLKFYGVLGTPFFYWFFPMSKDLECASRINTAELRAMCEKAATELGVKVYGGDCIIGDDNKPTIIDFNDWPSFAPCRQEAASSIAKSIFSEIRRFTKGEKH